MFAFSFSPETASFHCRSKNLNGRDLQMGRGPVLLSVSPQHGHMPQVRLAECLRMDCTSPYLIFQKSLVGSRDPGPVGWLGTKTHSVGLVRLTKK